uniref:Uncharacterized protein n=1 Tax=Ditylenchus dipsaci TaxID=166011 RepID=A0A915E1L5_9BILA
MPNYPQGTPDKPANLGCSGYSDCFVLLVSHVRIKGENVFALSLLATHMDAAFFRIDNFFMIFDCIKTESKYVK